MGRVVDFLRRQPPRDVAHLLADVVPPLAGCESLKLGLDIDGRLTFEPGASDLVVQRAVASAAQRAALN